MIRHLGFRPPLTAVICYLNQAIIPICTVATLIYPPLLTTIRGAYFPRLTKSRWGMPARRAPDRLACFAHSSSGFLSRFACVRLPRMGATQYSRWTELHSLGATLLLAPACWRIPSLHAPPGAAALQVSAHSVAVIVPPLPPP